MGVSSASRRTDLLLGAVVSAFGASLVHVSLPAIARAFATSPRTTTGVITTYLGAVTLALIPAGRAGERFGPERAFRGGFVLLGLGAVAAASAPSFGVLLLARTVHGAGAALLMAMGPVLAASRAAPEARGRAIGTQLAATYVGLAAGPLLGGMLTSMLGWRGPFALLAGLGAVGFGVGQTRRGVYVRAPQATPFGGGRALQSLLRSADLRVILLSAFLHYLALFVVVLALPFHVDHELGMPPQRAGLVLAIQPVAMALAAPLGGRFSDRFGTGQTVLGGAAGFTFALVALANTSQFGVGALAAASLGVGLGAGLFVSANTTALLAAAPSDRRASASALAALARNLGMAVGTALAALTTQSLPRSANVAAGVALGVLGIAYFSRPARPGG